MVSIHELDLESATAAEWAAYHRFCRERSAEDTPDLPVAADADRQRNLVAPNTTNAWRIFNAWRGDEVVGTAAAWWRREGTPNHEQFARFIHVRGGVLAASRRQGVGSALLAHLLPVMAERGATAVTLETHDDASAAFLLRRAAQEKFRAVENRLRLADVPWDDLERWQAKDDGALRWETHAGRVPVERLHALLPTLAELIGDVPRGELDVPPSPPDAARYRNIYRRMDEDGGSHLMVVAMAGDTVAAVCEAMWHAELPTTADQHFTGVARAFRGQGLARQAKARMLALLARELPQVQYVTTQNAESNAPMLRVNAALGFQPYRQVRILQVERDALAQALAGPR
ncbi:GNAT family N-acetyltransferase [Ramlibacter sp. XY19]|uniref:GNAT family N-acetyltransferase n=1 Tax=Ramlibacter paludis TaxID=2908000 RepID=UPI0023DAA560|nr:GNAT family N-acetyltransferase [Ramlibacter paludis]MCG2592264.1 GNAT family N-acetyltransferase [Ramlibacter paludis]